MCFRDSELSIIEKTQASVTLEINSEKEYKIVKSSDINKELSENQKNKMSIYSDLQREKSSLYKKYLKKL